MGKYPRVNQTSGSSRSKTVAKQPATPRSCPAASTSSSPASRSGSNQARPAGSAGSTQEAAHDLQRDAGRPPLVDAPDPGFGAADDLLAPMTRITCPAPDTSGPGWLPLAEAMSSDPASVSAGTLPATWPGEAARARISCCRVSRSIRYGRSRSGWERPDRSMSSAAPVASSVWEVLLYTSAPRAAQSPPASASRRCTSATAMDPSPLAAAQRLAGPQRTSPAANTPAGWSPAAAALWAVASRRPDHCRHRRR